MMQGAVKKGQDNAAKHIQVLQKQNDDIIERLNWMMKATQKLADKQGVELDDPLEEE